MKLYNFFKVITTANNFEWLLKVTFKITFTFFTSTVYKFASHGININRNSSF